MMATPELMMKTIYHLNPDALFVDGLDTALIGATYRGPGGRTVACYDRDKCIELIIEQDDLPYVEALEHFEKTVENVFIGKSSPLFISFFGSEIEIMLEIEEEEDEDV